jgi:hypothetical protein
MSPINALEVNAERLWTTIEQSGEIGRFRGTGLRRLALSARRHRNAAPARPERRQRIKITADHRYLLMPPD